MAARKGVGLRPGATGLSRAGHEKWHDGSRRGLRGAGRAPASI